MRKKPVAVILLRMVSFWGIIIALIGSCSLILISVYIRDALAFVFGSAIIMFCPLLIDAYEKAKQGELEWWRLKRTA